MRAATQHSGFGQILLTSFVTSLTTWLTLLTWRGFGEHSGLYLAPLMFSALLVVGVGAVLRWWRVAAPLVLLGQVAVVGAFVSRTLTGSYLLTGEHRDTFVTAWQTAVRAAQTYAAPVPEQFGTLEPVLLPLGALCLLLVDLLACSWRRVPMAGLALLTIYAVGVSVLGGVGWPLFVLPGMGYLAMLFLHQDEYVARWGRGLGGSAGPADAQAFGVRTGAARGTALGISGAAMAFAVMVPLLLPTLHLAVFSGGLGNGNGNVKITNPILDMRRNLERGNDIALLRMETDDPAPAYLRISVLKRFSGAEWSAGDREIPVDQLADGALPPLAGVTGGVARREHVYRVTSLPSFDSRWLPAMASATYLNAFGNWRYDRDTMDFLAGDDGTNTRNLTYDMRAVTLDLHARALAAAPRPTGTLATSYTSLPSFVPRELLSQAALLTADAPTNYQKAVILQNWFRRDGGFEYNLERADEGNGVDALSAFLKNRVGYCEQFASAMAVMARSVGIPARIAIGFLAPDRVAANVYEYSAWDLHAWPELYFPGAGWVRFEPTPGSRVNAVAPAYTRERLPQQIDNSPSVSPPASDLEPLRPSRSSSPDRVEADPAQATGGTWVSLVKTLLAITAGLVVVVGLAMLPGWLRRSRRTRRWAAADAGPESAWLELRDAAVDLGRRWPYGLSPRAAAVQIADWFGDPDDPHPPERPAHGPDYAPAALAALGRIVQALERVRYARTYDGADIAALRDDTELVTLAMTAGAVRKARRQARWLPASVLHRRGPAMAPKAADPIDQGRLVDHVG